jgi:hypothetical protein
VTVLRDEKRTGNKGLIVKKRKTLSKHPSQYTHSSPRWRGGD